MAQELFAQLGAAALADQGIQIKPCGVHVGARFAVIEAEVAGNPERSGGARARSSRLRGPFNEQHAQTLCRRYQRRGHSGSAGA